MHDLASYEKYLASLVPQPQLRLIKDVEMDLKDILNPSELLNQLYFVQHNYLSFDDFFELYATTHDSELHKRFNIKDWQLFSDGLRARLYRTQFGFLTEYHAYFLCKHVFGDSLVERSTALDKIGVDFRVKLHNENYNIHIFVDTKRAWAYRQYKSRTKQVDTHQGVHVNLPYALEEGRFNSLHFLPNRFGIYTAAYIQYFEKEVLAGCIKNNNIVGTTSSGFVYR
jgi:hypothetical protein